MNCCRRYGRPRLPLERLSYLIIEPLTEVVQFSRNFIWYGIENLDALLLLIVEIANAVDVNRYGALLFGYIGQTLLDRTAVRFRQPNL